MHITSQPLHAYRKRGLDVRVSVKTTEAPGAFIAITFRVGADLIEKTGLSASATSTGFDVDLTLTALELDVAAREYRWELVATFGGEVRTLAQGPFTVDPELTR